MKAIGFQQHLPIKEANSLIDLEIERPVAQGQDVLVEVKAVSINPVDTKVRAHGSDESEPKIIGYDAAGIVVEVGDQASLFSVGDEVYYAGAINRPGSNSDFQLVDERIVAKKPGRLTFSEAAALPLTALTAYEALTDRLHLTFDAKSNLEKTMLIIGAAGGVGSIATQLANKAGLTIIGTASRPETIDWAKAHGAHHTINHHEDFRQQLEQLGYHHVDYIFCLNATDQHFEAMVDVIAPQGMICSIVETDQKLDLSALQQKSATFVWEFMFTRSLFETPDMIRQHEILTQVATWLDEETLETTVTQTLIGLNAANLKEAHRLVESGKTIGKIVVEQQ
ncbi:MULTISPECIES: zinc-binding alcohol dehydrogenase family protein [Exiguobacterium]|uniref:Zinc-type alcohol dehydrogenase-like protein n=1 Tax=Exiguobacterium antarcticum TaxID=132920 RepID=A0ABT6R266_9BACL|nr:MULTISPECIES: zinc-binding alcohol dehydrogenase family protein [Exiguobacterium]MCT4781402.1 zinc-binding alcohol dehydrogenase family protein [Exiguobacterium soli]MDI3234374.1 zinc-binding alcohol dehydrogenase family protein [Exiguobacterium antarcticum]